MSLSRWLDIRVPSPNWADRLRWTLYEKIPAYTFRDEPPEELSQLTVVANAIRRFVAGLPWLGRFLRSARLERFLIRAQAKWLRFTWWRYGFKTGTYEVRAMSHEQKIAAGKTKPAGWTAKEWRVYKTTGWPPITITYQ